MVQSSLPQIRYNRNGSYPENRIVELPAGLVSTLFLAFLCCVNAFAQKPAARLQTAFGVTRTGMPMQVDAHRQSFDVHSAATHLLFIGGLDGNAESVALTEHLLADSESWDSPFIVSAIANANPEGMRDGTGTRNSVGGQPAVGYPPADKDAYNSTTNPEASYVWRWIGMHAPDLLIEVRAGSATQWTVSTSFAEQWPQVTSRLAAVVGFDRPDALVTALGTSVPNRTGMVPAIRVTARLEAAPAVRQSLQHVLQETSFRGPSAARRELQHRDKRSALDVAQQLSQHYGQSLPQVVYIPGMALIGRLRLGELSNTNETMHRTDVERIVEPYVSGKLKPDVGNGSALSGHLVFSELASRSEGSVRDRYIALARVAADLAFDEQGNPRASMPHHSEMSDALFMGGPILAHVGQLTGEARYFNACMTHLEFMRKLCLRDDGLYRHSPLCEAAWGRGNGFPALGLALCLTHFPNSHPRHGELLTWFQHHMQALTQHQDHTGCWHQVIDHPESYRELTATCMITFAMMRGVERGWLDREQFGRHIDAGWHAIKLRVAADGTLVDVCTGTGKQPSLRHYFDRPAILGRDDRGGAMSLLAATERIAYERSQSK